MVYIAVFESIGRDGLTMTRQEIMAYVVLCGFGFISGMIGGAIIAEGKLEHFKSEADSQCRQIVKMLEP